MDRLKDYKSLLFKLIKLNIPESYRTFRLGLLDDYENSIIFTVYSGEYICAGLHYFSITKKAINIHFDDIYPQSRYGQTALPFAEYGNSWIICPYKCNKNSNYLNQLIDYYYFIA